MLATSSNRPKRFIGNFRSDLLRPLVNGFLCQLHRIPDWCDEGPGSNLIGRASDRSAALLAAYALVPGVPRLSAMLVFNM